MKTIFITGASSGIGKAAANYFSARGWNVAATMRSPAKEHELTKVENIKLYQLDVTDQKSIDEALDRAIEDFGKIDVLVNNAGYGVDGVFEAMSDDVIQKQFDTNVFGLMRVTRAIIPHMRAWGGGTIIQLASMGGRLTFPFYSIYHASKWAVEGFSESLRYELRQFNIKIRAIEPGTIKTEFYGRSRLAIAPAELAMYVKDLKWADIVSQGSGHSGVSPDVVAKAIYRAAVSTGNRFRYPVGRPAPVLLIAKKLLPERVFFFLVRKAYRID